MTQRFSVGDTVTCINLRDAERAELKIGHTYTVTNEYETERGQRICVDGKNHRMDGWFAWRFKLAASMEDTRDYLESITTKENELCDNQ